MTPFKATIRSYQVGFGDCFLLTFHYQASAGKEEQRHVLIDCGSTAPPLAYAKAKKEFSLDPVAEEIKNVTDGKLQAVVTTHRHKDHISGFATAANGKGAGDILRSLSPDLVLQPWTEDPDLPTDATKPKSLRQASGKFALGLQGMHQFSAGLMKELASLKPALGVRLTEQLAFLGDDNLANPLAVKNLMTMGKNEYLHYGKETELEKLLPGVKVKVLGPPTLEQNTKVAKQRSEDAAEFWHLRGAAASGRTTGGSCPFAAHHRVSAQLFPPELRWIIPRVQASRGAQLMELVRILDKQMNNTSLILLFQFGKKTLLFSGDAQIENWSHALKDAREADDNRKLLAATDLYKVGHHGSLNATPKTLWGLFAKKGAGKKSLQTMLSTRAGKHGDKASKTEVPRTTLLEELDKKSLLYDTETLSGTEVKCHIATVE